MRIWSTTRRTLPLVAVFGVLAAGLVAGPGTAPTQHVEVKNTPATVDEHTVPLRETAEEKPQTRLSGEEGASAGSHSDDELESGLVVASTQRTGLKPFSMLGVTWDSGLRETAGQSLVEVRWHKLDGSWSPWTELHIDPAPGEGGREGTEPQWVDKADGAAVRVMSKQATKVEGLRLATVDPGSTPDVTPTAATVGQPRIISRASWNARPNSGCDSPRYGKSTLGAVVHHTVGSNSYTKAQSAGIVKAAQSYHMNARDWCDIGYNFLVDRYGQIFEGRSGGITKMVRAAHAGNGAVNERMIGVSLMGTFSTVAPTSAMKAAADDLVAWRFSRAGIPAKGTFSIGGLRLNRISGHRNVVATECPGAKAYSWVVNDMRDAVARRMARPSSGASPSQPSKLPTPTGLTITKRTNSSLSLDWAPVSGASKYAVQYSRSSSMSSPTTVVASSSGATLSGLKADTRYYVRVAVRDDASTTLRSSYSAVRNAPTYRWAAPTGLKVTKRTTSSLSLDWAGTTGAKKYVVQVSRSSSFTSPKYVAFSTSKGTVTGLKRAGATYYVRVVIKHSKTNDPLSTWSSAVKTSTTGSSSSTDKKTIGSASSITLKGHGYGHGIGMSQWGARGGADRGATWSQILAKYYPGTKLSTKSGYIRVHVTADDDGSTAVAGRSGLTFVRGSSRTSLPTKASSGTITAWRIEPTSSDRRRSVLRFKTGSSWHTFRSMTWAGSADFAAPTIKVLLPGGRSATYRYKVRAARPSSTSTVRRTVNVLPIDDYTRGVVAREMPSSWNLDAVRAQAVAARTYGARTMGSSGWYDICDTTSCQVYGGMSAETSRSNEAVSQTRGKVLTYGGKLAFTQFSASSGGYTNKGSQPYLKAVSDEWDGVSSNANHSWSIKVPVSRIRSAYPSIGTPRTVTVTKRNGLGSMGGRVLSVTFSGSKGSRTVSGNDVRWAFGLKSDWFGF